ncbi:MAG TPA: response regulator [Pirellulales bacterium]|jgi:CheY-like chemotaxis protein|nr:response regulator [Pirellulales bacterium]
MKLRVLIVDDSRDALHLLDRLMAHHDCEIRTCQDSVNAVQTVQEFIPHVIFLDIAMPGLDGFEVAEDLHDLNLPNYLLVALTSHSDEPHRKECEASGFELFLSKPVSIEDVGHVIQLAKKRFLATI